MSVSRNNFRQGLDEQTMKESRENDVDTPAKLKKELKEGKHMDSPYDFNGDA